MSISHRKTKAGFDPLYKRSELHPNHLLVILVIPPGHQITVHTAIGRRYPLQATSIPPSASCRLRITLKHQPKLTFRSTSCAHVSPSHSPHPDCAPRPQPRHVPPAPTRSFRAPMSRTTQRCFHALVPPQRLWAPRGRGMLAARRGSHRVEVLSNRTWPVDVVPSGAALIRRHADAGGASPIRQDSDNT